MLTWTAVIWLTIGVSAQRLVGMFLLRADDRRQGMVEFVNLIPVTVVMSVIALQTVTTAGEFTIDARVIGVGVAAVLAWRRASLAMVVLGAALATALVRLIA